MAYISDRIDGTTSAAIGENVTRQTLEESIQRLAGEIVQTKEILGINIPQVQSEKESVPFGKVEMMTRIINDLFREVRTSNETLRGL